MLFLEILCPDWLDALCILCLDPDLTVAGEAAENFLKILVQSDTILKEASDARLAQKSGLFIIDKDSEEKIDTILLTPLLDATDIKKLYQSGFLLVCFIRLF